MIFSDTNIPTLNGLKQDLYYLGKFSAATFSAGDVNRIINKYYKIVQDDLRGVNEDFFLLSTTATLQLQSVAQGKYTLPTDYEKIKRIFVAATPASITATLYTEYVPVNIIDANAITDPSYAFSNPTAVFFGQYFTLYPFYTDVTKYPVLLGVKMYYIPIQADLINDSDVPLIFSDYHDVITWGSLIDISTRLGNTELRAKAEKMFDKRRAELRKYASGRVLDVETSYVEGQGNAGGWSFPFGRNGI